MNNFSLKIDKKILKHYTYICTFFLAMLVLLRTFSSSLSTTISKFTNESFYESSSSSTESKNSDSDSEENSTTELYAITFTNLTKED